MRLQSKEGLHRKLRDKKYRDAFVSAGISNSLSLQLRILRQRAGLSQEDLARKLGTSQNAISRMEDPKYGRPSISTLKKIASYFDVGLVVRFAPYGEIADWDLNLSQESMEVPDFNHDTRLAPAAVRGKAPYAPPGRKSPNRAPRGRGVRFSRDVGTPAMSGRK
jgi:transcriptional regulator with XRE-family HTH domain